MFTLGNKECIVNSEAKFPVSFNTADDKMTIQGFGTFDENQIVSAVCQRYKPSRVEVMNITAPTATALGVTGTNVPVTFSVRVKTYRDASEWATDYIVNGRPMVFEILVSVGDTSTVVGDAMAAAFAEWVAKFNYADQGLPFTYSATAGVVTLTLKDYTLFFQERVEFMVNREFVPVAATTTKLIDSGVTVSGAPVGNVVTLSSAVHNIMVGDIVTSTGSSTEVTVTAISASTPSITLSDATGWADTNVVYLKTTALDPNFSGKYLEENVRMSLATTSDSYGISPDEKPLISGQYAMITFTMNDANTGGIDGSHAKHAFLGTTRGEIGGTRQFKFTIYILEGTSMFTALAGNKAFDIVDFLDDSPITPTLLLGTGEVAADAAAWVA